MIASLTKQAILAQEEKLFQAMRAGDIAMLDRLLHDDLLFLLPNGMLITKDMDLDTYRDGSFFIKELTADFEDFAIIGDTAVNSMHVTITGDFIRKPFTNNFRYIRIWKLFPDGLKVIAGSGIVIPA